MKQYIDKAAAVAEIDEIIADETESIKCFERSRNVCEVTRSNARISVLTHLRSLFDTLEVKEIDLDKEFEDFLDNVEGVPRMWHSDEQIEWAKDIAKHFFELGLKTQKGE